MNGIVAYGAHVPFARLDRKLIGQALGVAGGKGTRAVAGYDEDTTSMGVEAARVALRGAPGLTPAGVYFATAAPAYLDKTNATAIHAALALPDVRDVVDVARLGAVGDGRAVSTCRRRTADAGRASMRGMKWASSRR